MDWIVLIYRLPTNDSRARVAVWRELRRSGAHHLQQSVVAVPDTPKPHWTSPAWPDFNQPLFSAKFFTTTEQWRGCLS